MKGVLSGYVNIIWKWKNTKKEKDVTIKYRSFLLNAKKYSENPKYDDHINNIIERIQKQIDKIEQQ